MMEFGSKPTHRNLLISAQFLHKELPIRIARRAIELEKLPYGLSEKPAILKVLSFFSSHIACYLFLIISLLGIVKDGIFKKKIISVLWFFLVFAIDL